MANQRVVEQALSRSERQALANKRTAVTVFQVSWIMVFVCLIVVNLQIRSSYPTWPPPGVDALDRILPTVATIGRPMGLRCHPGRSTKTGLRPW